MNVFNIICYSLSFFCFILAFIILFSSKILKKEDKKKAVGDVLPTIIYRIVFFVGVIG